MRAVHLSILLSVGCSFNGGLVSKFCFQLMGFVFDCAGLFCCVTGVVTDLTLIITFWNPLVFLGPSWASGSAWCCNRTFWVTRFQLMEYTVKRPCPSNRRVMCGCSAEPVLWSLSLRLSRDTLPSRNPTWGLEVFKDSWRVHYDWSFLTSLL